MGQTVFIAKEIDANEPRVAAPPVTVKTRTRLRHEVLIDAGAGP